MNIFKKLYLTVKNPSIGITCSNCETTQTWSFRMNQDQRPSHTRIFCPNCGKPIFISQKDMNDMFDLLKVKL